MKDVFDGAHANQWLTVDNLAFKGLDLRIKHVETSERLIDGVNHPFKDLLLYPVKQGEELRSIKVRSFLSDDTANVVVLELLDEFGFKDVPDFGDILEAENGEFHHHAPDNSETVYVRHDGVKTPYECRATVREGFGKMSSRRFFLHIYSRDVEEDGTTRPEFLMIEQDATSGWYQLWKGFPVTPLAVSLI